MEFKKMGVKDKAVQNYKKYVKGNEDVSDEICKLKILRNWYAGTQTSEVTVRYGNLIIRKHPNRDLIIRVFNSETQSGYVNLEIKKELNKLWNIKGEV